MLGFDAVKEFINRGDIIGVVGHPGTRCTFVSDHASASSFSIILRGRVAIHSIVSYSCLFPKLGQQQWR